MKFVTQSKFPDVVIHQKLWRFLGFGSSVVGFICYSLSSSFHDLFGHWNLWKILLFSFTSFIISVSMLFVNKCPRFPRGFLMQTQVAFLVLMLTSLYSYREDRSGEGKIKDQKGQNIYEGILSLVSCGAFSLMSMSLSRQIQPGFDVGVSNFFLGYLIVEVMKRNFRIAVGLGVLSYVLIGIRSYSDSLLERRRLSDEGGQCDNLNHTQAHHVAIKVHDEKQSSSVNNSKVEEEDETNIQSNDTNEGFVDPYSAQDIDEPEPEPESEDTSTIRTKPNFYSLDHPVADEFLDRADRSKRKRKARKRKARTQAKGP